MKRHLTNGIAFLLPIALVIFVLSWLYEKGQLIVELIVPASWGSAWWYPILGVLAIVLFIIIIGLIFSKIAPFRWAYKKFENWIIGRIPFVNKIYGFGKEVADSLITDVKEDGYLAVVEVEMFGGKSLGVLMDPERNTCFIPTAPNPSNGFLVRTEKYAIVKTMAYMEAIQFVVSMGKINNEKW